MAIFSLHIARTFIHVSEVPSKPWQPRSKSLPPGECKFGTATVDSCASTTAPSSEHDEAVNSSPKQPQQKKKRRPCKGQRDRIKKQLVAIERKIEVDPCNIDVAAIVLPACYTECTQNRIRAFFQSKLEEMNCSVQL